MRYILILTFTALLASGFSFSARAVEPQLDPGAPSELGPRVAEFAEALSVVSRDEREADVGSLLALWRLAADVGIPAEALHAFDRVLSAKPPRSEEAAVARQALEDLERLASRELTPPDSDGVEPPRLDSVGEGRGDAMSSNDRAIDPERLNALRLAIARDRDGDDQVSAIAELALYRGEEIVLALAEAAELAQPAARAAVVRALWIVSADNEDATLLEEQLTDLELDSDAEVASIASQALADLTALRAEVDP